MTHAVVNRLDLYAEVKRLLADKFPSGEISDVQIEQDLDETGERVLLITVFFEGPTDQFISAKPPGLIRFIRNKLVEAHESAFPMLSFVSAREMRV